jgi:hypothetical protein
VNYNRLSWFSLMQLRSVLVRNLFSLFCILISPFILFFLAIKVLILECFNAKKASNNKSE